jgi:hypothetical protein
MASAINVQIRYIPEVTRGAHGGFMALCKEFQLAASGESEYEAKARLRVIVESYCSALQRKGLLDKALMETGMRSEPIAREPQEEIVSVAA